MFVCICNAFNEKRVKDVMAANPDMTKTKEIYGCCANGAEPPCGKCLPVIKDMLNKKHDTAPQSRL
jgi:bacterioferritin-associated ferredoxin